MLYWLSIILRTRCVFPTPVGPVNIAVCGYFLVWSLGSRPRGCNPPSWYSKSLPPPRMPDRARGPYPGIVCLGCFLANLRVGSCDPPFQLIFMLFIFDAHVGFYVFQPWRSFGKFTTLTKEPPTLPTAPFRSSVSPILPFPSPREKTWCSWKTTATDRLS